MGPKRQRPWTRAALGMMLQKRVCRETAFR